ncbi:nuclease-related domain-containing protein [Promicromonospora sp. NPDC023987]|uniref:nuclease-related domain-containing protein n=1 Tax=Promicromonospora sp. NPDC023987 TaxID=3155360 RepID=UPI0034094E48
MADDQERDAGPTITTKFSNAYGKRPPTLHVTVDGERIGHWDIGAKVAVLDDPRHQKAAEHLATIESAALAWHVRQDQRREKKARAAARKEAATAEPMRTAQAPVSAPATTPAVPETPAPSSLTRPASTRPTPQPLPADRGRDLSLNKAGEGIRVTARAKFREAPLTNLFKRLTGRQTGDDWSWRQGVRGEREVGRALDKAIAGRNGWRLLHGIKRNVRGTDVDHLLIGPGGIFSINAKFHQGKKVWVGEHAVVVGRTATRHVFAARSEAKAVKKVLDAACATPRPVTPVVVITGSSRFSRGTKTPEDVVVLSVAEISSWLNALGETVRPWEVEQLYEAARWERTWITL